jgi:hypothetical protein
VIFWFKFLILWFRKPCLGFWLRRRRSWWLCRILESRSHRCSRSWKINKINLYESLKVINPHLKQLWGLRKEYGENRNSYEKPMISSNTLMFMILCKGVVMLKLKDITETSNFFLAYFYRILFCFCPKIFLKHSLL